MSKTAGILGEDTILSQLQIKDSTEDMKRAYQSSEPFPHIILDGVFDHNRLVRLLEEAKTASLTDWVHHSTQNLNKYGQRSALALGEEGMRFVSLLYSAPFLYFLSEITDIWNLIPDPYLHGAGFSVIPKGSKFDVHVDRNADPTVGLVRQLALIVYLNEDWTPEDGGCLELWNATGTSRVKTVNPQFNRLLLMEISDTAYHGINPVTERSGRSRYSFMLYYNSAGIGLNKEQGVHSSIYAPNCYQQKPPLRTYVSRLLPPILVDFARQQVSKWHKDVK